MRYRLGAILAVAVLCLAPTATWADLAPYSQDFEGLTPAPQPEDPFESSLADDGWLVFANVFGPGFFYNYGPFPAPNHGGAFSAVETGQGGPEQGLRQLSVFSDYRNGNHYDGTGALIESNVFQEQLITAADIGSTWTFEFDARRANLGGSSTAAAWFKTIVLEPCCSLGLFLPVDMTEIPDTWDRYSVSITIDPSLEGQLLQFGFLNNASNGEDSGIFYDNLNFFREPLAVSLDVKPGSCPNPMNNNSRSRGVLPVALLGTGDLDVSLIDPASLELEGVAPLRWSYEDVAAPFTEDLCGCTEAGPDGYLDLTLKFAAQEVIAAIGSPSRGERPTLTLTGALLDGTPIEGQDCIMIVGRDSRPRLQHPALGGQQLRSGSRLKSR